VQRGEAGHDTGGRAGGEARDRDDEARDDGSSGLCHDDDQGARAVKPLIAAALCMVVVAACAAGGKRAATSTAPESTQAPTMAGGSPDMASPKQQLDMLYDELEQERQSLQLPEPQIESGTAPPMPMATEPMPTSTTDKTCKHAPSETCTTSCTLSDKICDNREKICKLAGELAGDQDAADKCTKATKTCKSSHEKCCGCL
jgi:hypothetical protein